jgi:hypothetical protein
MRGRTVVTVLAVLGAWVAFGATTAGARMAAYGAAVRATGTLVVTFSGGDVKSGTITWSAPARGGFELLASGSGTRRRLRGYLQLTGHRPATTTAVTRQSGVCADTSRFGDEIQLPVTETGSGGLRFGLFAHKVTLPSFGPPQTPLALVFNYIAAGSQPDEPAPTACGGPLPGDFLRLLPGRTVSLRRLASGATTIDLSGTAAFSSGGLSGTVRSNIVLHVAKLRGSVVPTRRPHVPLSQENRVLYVHYRIARVTGSVGVGFNDVPSTCAAFDSCGMSGAVDVQPGSAHGSFEMIAYDDASVSSTALRRSVGLEPGRPPRGEQVGGIGIWRSTTGTVSEKVQRSGVLFCQDSAHIPVGGIDIAVTGRRATADFGDTGGLQLLTPERDLLRTRCSGPVMADLSGAGLAREVFPARWLGRRTLTLHLTRGTSVGVPALGPAPAFTWHSQPDLTVVLQRTGVTEKLLPSSDFET